MVTSRPSPETSPVRSPLTLPGNRDFQAAYGPFRDKLASLKAEHPLDSPHGYYPYTTIGIVQQILPLSDAHGVDLKSFVADRTVLDLGCGDGDLSFFFESNGAKKITSVDWAPTNFNGLRGYRTVASLLESQNELIDHDFHGMDLSNIGPFDSIFCFGFLYHSPHPLWVLQQLARLTSNLFITTKIFDNEESYVYFYDEAECNNDASNWWCPTPKALRLLLKRAGFDVVLMERLDRHVGSSHPVDMALDGRAYAVARRS
jgi:tRNA (mo5U34)-methyltransferase